MKKRYSNQVLAMLLMATLGTAALAGAQKSAAADVQLQAAIHKQTVEGDLEQAIRMYKDIVSKYSANHAVAASALLHMGQAYEKLGSAEALKAYEQVTQKFSDQKDVAADAGRRLAALGIPPRSVRPEPRFVLDSNAVDSPSVSWDGQWMVMIDWSTGNPDLVIRDMSTGQLQKLQSGSCNPNGRECVYADNPVLSPNSRQVAYVWYDDSKNSTNDHGQLQVIANEAGAKPRVLVGSPEFGIWPNAWSLDGKSILVTIRKADGTYQMAWVSVADPSIKKVVKSVEWRLKGTPSLSPDGRYIAYSALAINPSKPQGRPEITDQHIYVLAADGSSEVELVKTAAINQRPVWTPDGTHIVFTSNLSGTSDLWSIAVRDGKPFGSKLGSPSLMRREIGDIETVGMTRSGSYFYTAGAPAELERVSIAELSPGAGSRVTDSFVGFSPTWLSDGKSIGFLRHSTDGNYMVTRSIETGDEKMYTPGHAQLNGVPPKFFHDGSGFLHDGREKSSDHFSIYFIGKDSGEIKQVWSATDGNRGVDFAISPDDKTLYLFTGDPKSWNTSRNLLDRIIAYDISSKQSKTVFKLTGTVETLPAPLGGGIALSPDGRTLAFTTNNFKTNEVHLALVRTDGSDYREIYFPIYSSSLVSKLAWTKDGRALVFATTAKGDNGSGDWQIMRIGIDGGKPEFTGLRIKDLRTFDLSPDGSRIAFDANAGSSTSELLVIDNLSALLKDSK